MTIAPPHSNVVPCWLSLGHGQFALATLTPSPGTHSLLLARLGCDPITLPLPAIWLAWREGECDGSPNMFFQLVRDGDKWWMHVWPDKNLPHFIGVPWSAITTFLSQAS
jgi:hypothetical protein